MNLCFYQRAPKRYRFQVTNEIWTWELKPQAFAILTYLCYLHTHGQKFVPPGADELATSLHMSKNMAASQLSELHHRGLLDQQMAPMLQSSGKHFSLCPMNCSSWTSVTVPSRSTPICSTVKTAGTHQCHPSYRTIAAAVHLTVSTVMKHIAKLEDRQLIAVESTSYLDSRGMKWNGNNQYTILPIQAAVDYCYQQQMRRLDQQRKWQQAQKRLEKSAGNAPCAPL